MRIPLTVTVSLVLLTGCDGSIKRSDRSDDKSVHIAMDQNGDSSRMSVDIPGMNAKVALPMMDLGRHVDLDGIKLAPETRVGAIDVAARDKDEANEGSGRVQLNFTNPQAPAALIDYYRRAAAAAGYGGVTASAGTLSASKRDKTFNLAVKADGAGSSGTIVVGGGEN